MARRNNPAKRLGGAILGLGCAGTFIGSAATFGAVFDEPMSWRPDSLPVVLTAASLCFAAAACVAEWIARTSSGPPRPRWMRWLWSRVGFALPIGLLVGVVLALALRPSLSRRTHAAAVFEGVGETQEVTVPEP